PDSPRDGGEGRQKAASRFPESLDTVNLEFLHSHFIRAGMTLARPKTRRHYHLKRDLPGIPAWNSAAGLIKVEGNLDRSRERRRFSVEAQRGLESPAPHRFDGSFIESAADAFCDANVRGASLGSDRHGEDDDSLQLCFHGIFGKL